MPYDPAIPLLGIYPERMQTLIWKDTCISKFIATQFIIAKTWKQHKCPLTDEWIKKMWYIHIILLSLKKEWNNSICSNMDGPRGYHTKWSKSDREKQIYHLYVKSKKKWYKWTYLQNRNRLTDIENKLMFTKGESEG